MQSVVASPAPAWRAVSISAAFSDTVFAFADIPAAYRRIESQRHMGKVVIGYATGSPVSVQMLEQRANGVSVVTLDRGVSRDAARRAPWLLLGAKTLSYAVNMAALRHADSLGAEDVVFISTDGYVLEGPTSTVVLAEQSTVQVAEPIACGQRNPAPIPSVSGRRHRAGLSLNAAVNGRNRSRPRSNLSAIGCNDVPQGRGGRPQY